jgi:hypothetical protein
MIIQMWALVFVLYKCSVPYEICIWSEVSAFVWPQNCLEDSSYININKFETLQLEKKSHQNQTWIKIKKIGHWSLLTLAYFGNDKTLQQLCPHIPDRNIQDRFCTITLVLYIGSLPILATWFPCGRGRTLFILSSLPLYRLIIYIDGRILWCRPWPLP